LPAGIFVLGLGLIPADSDGALAAINGVTYGLSAETERLDTIAPHHPLFHTLARALVGPLRALGVERPGHAAVRVLSGAGAAAVLVLVIRLAGRDRRLLGVGFALLLSCTRGFLVDASVGDTILPGCAGALFALTLATRASSRPKAIGAAAALAMLLRQDARLALPGILSAAASSVARGLRLRRVVAILSVAAVLTIPGYLAAWFVAGGGEDLFEFLLRTQRKGDLDAWGAARGTPAILQMVDAFGALVTGRYWPWSGRNLWIGPLFVAALLVAGGFARGRRSIRPLVIGVGLTWVFWLPFFLWWRPFHWDYFLLPVSFLAALASGAVADDALVDGESTRMPPRGCAVAASLAAVAGLILASHLPSTVRLRDRRLMAAVEKATARAPPEARFLSMGLRVDLAFSMAGIPEDRSSNVVGDVLIGLRRRIESSPVPTMVVIDRFVWDGMLYTLDHVGNLYHELDRLEPTARIRLFRAEGRVFAVLVAPPASEELP
jgi:hypothetical protein